MPQPVTLSSMLTSITRRANIENFVAESGSLITNPELREYVNEVGQELYDLLIQARGQEFYRKAFIFTTQPNVGEYSLPADFYQLLSVDIFIAPNQVITARPYMEEERNRYRWLPGWFYNLPVLYRLQGSPTSKGAVLQPQRITFIPQPPATNTVSVNYYPVFKLWATDGSEDSFVFDGVAGWESYIVWGVAAMCLEKMEQSSEFALAQRGRVEQRIREMASERDAGNAERVHDVTPETEPFGFGVT